MVFGFNLSFGIFLGDDGQSKQDISDVDTSNHPPAPSTTRTANAKRSSQKVSREQAARDQRERELQADRESLHQLEMATSGKARRLDRGSLAALERSTQGREFWHRRVDTPPSAWNYPIIHRLKGIDSDPGGYAPSKSSRPPVSSSSPSPRPSRRVSHRNAAAATPKDGLRAELAAAGWSTDSIEDLVKSQGSKKEHRVGSVHEWFDRLDEREAGRSLEGLEDNISGSVGSMPLPSSGAEDSGRASVEDGKPGGKEKRSCENGGRVQPAHGANKQSIQRRGGGEDGMSSDDDWVSLDYISDDS